MSGHSKWATTKRRKAAVDAKRGKIFSMLSKELTIAARDGGGDLEFNPRLRTTVEKAKMMNMPAENIERAIKKGTGELPGQVIEELTYEGYAPGGVGVIVEVTTDNKNRSASLIRSTFTKHGGNLAGSGALAFNFQRKGQFLIGTEKVEEDVLLEIALEGGAEDVINNKDHYEVLCEVGDFYALSQVFLDKNIQAESAELVYIPNSTVTVTEKELARKVLRFVEVLEDLEEVKSVHANFEIDEQIL